MPDQEHRQLAIRLGGEYTRIMIGILPQLAAVMDRHRAASVIVEAKFLRTKDGGMTCRLQPKSQIPMDAIEMKITMHHGQLSLFEGEPADNE